jgi:hypothetical protein
MRQGPNNKRMRGRGNGRKHSNPRNQTFESNGPDVKVRGNAQQVVEKYLALARDASSAGDRISAESYYQYAEHYYRIMNANLAHEQRQQMPTMDGSSFDDSDQDQDDAAGGENGYDRHHQGGQQAQRHDQEDASTGDDEDGAEAAEAAGDGQRQNANPNGNGHGGSRRRGGRHGGRRRDGGNQPEVEAAGGDGAPASADEAGEGVGA